MQKSVSSPPDGFSGSHLTEALSLDGQMSLAALALYHSFDMSNGLLDYCRTTFRTELPLVPCDVATRILNRKKNFSCVAMLSCSIGCTDRIFPTHTRPRNIIGTKQSLVLEFLGSSRQCETSAWCTPRTSEFMAQSATILSRRSHPLGRPFTVFLRLRKLARYDGGSRRQVG